MITNQQITQKQFYLVTVDIIQGISLFIFIIWHTLLWWDELIDTTWPNVEFITFAFMTIALVVPPFFFFLYGFNTVNSLLRKEESERRETRIRLVKKTLILLLIAEISQGLVGIVISTELLLNFLLTWELFHMFAFSTIFLLFVFEIGWKIEKKSSKNHKRVTTTILLFILILVITIFLIIHDYSLSQGIQEIYVNLDSSSILQRILGEYGQNPLIPFFSFPILGGLVASFLDLPNEQQIVVLKKSGVVLAGGVFAFITGIVFLTIERYVSTPLRYPASTSFVFITIGLLILVTLIGILLLDFNSLQSRQTINKLFLPMVLVSHISLTVFIFHNLAYIIPSESLLIQALIPSENVVLIVGILYSIFFIIVAFIWQKWNYKYSIEMMIWKLQRARWRLWTKKPVETSS
ncbi:MAG: hypothetical protein ACXAEU_12825 [Candidatus Hodarchaeales archaeon]|jgi:hypothetical protein